MPQDSRALHLELFAVPSTLATFYEIIKEVLHGAPCGKVWGQAKRSLQAVWSPMKRHALSQRPPAKPEA